MAKKSFVKGAAILGMAGIAIKFLGAVFRIPLVNWIGDTGMANYNPAYYIYNFFLILATAGLPVAISRMVSERIALGNYREAHRVFKISLALMISIGIFSFIVLFAFAGPIAAMCNNPQAALAMRAIAPSLILVPIMAAYRGYFQGMQNMKPTAISQVVEQLFRVVFGLTLSYVMFFVVKTGFFADNYDKYERGAAGASFGGTAGSIGGLLVILIIYMVCRKTIKERAAHTGNKERESGGTVMKKILIIAIPITIGAAIMPIINLIDVPIVMNRLQHAGFSHEVAKSLYGQLSGFVGSLINFPQVLTQAVAMSLVPLVAAAHKTRDTEFLKENVALGLRIAIIIGMPCALGLMSLAEPILLLLYPSQRASAISASSILVTMAFGVIFLSTVQTLTGVLQGVGKQLIPVRNLAIGVGCKVVITWTLVAIPAINVQGAAIGTATAYIVAAVLNILAVRKYTHTQIKIGLTFVRPLISALVMSLCAILVYRVVFAVCDHNSIATLAAVLAAVIIYVIMIFVTKSIDKNEVEKLPKGDKILKIINKFLK